MVRWTKVQRRAEEIVFSVCSYERRISHWIHARSFGAVAAVPKGGWRNAKALVVLVACGKVQRDSKSCRNCECSDAVNPLSAAYSA